MTHNETRLIGMLKAHERYITLRLKITALLNEIKKLNELRRDNLKHMGLLDSQYVRRINEITCSRNKLIRKAWNARKDFRLRRTVIAACMRPWKYQQAVQNRLQRTVKNAYSTLPHAADLKGFCTLDELAEDFGFTRKTIEKWGRSGYIRKAFARYNGNRVVMLHEQDFVRYMNTPEIRKYAK